MNIIGLSAFYHESACCLLHEGRLVAAVSEERFTRVKHDPRLPVHAFRHCLHQANLSPDDIDAIAYYEDPHKKAARQRTFEAFPDEDAAVRIDPTRPERMIRDYLGFEGPILTFDHHLCHAASAYYFSGFDEAAVLTVDGVGEWAAMSYGHGAGNNLDLFETVDFPHSLGLFYATITAFLGFRVNNGEYKVMGLAAYGEPRYLDQMHQLLHNEPDGQFRLDMDYFDFLSGERMFSNRLTDLLGQPPRQPEAPVAQHHCDIAKSAQVALEEILLEKINYLAEKVDSRQLCLAGGVALNAVANGRIRRESPFTNLFAQPAAGDAGTCLGAAALAHRELVGQRPVQTSLPHVYLGPTSAPDDISTMMAELGAPASDYRADEQVLLSDVAERLAQGDIVGWFHGAMEFGPRALGARSILADPRRPEMRDVINQRIKRRESFRPFAPAVLRAHAAEHFDLRAEVPFMNETCRVISPLSLPAVTHVDGSARPQTVDKERAPRFTALLEAFYARTGCPILLNTSFNMRGQPIVCTPVDALFCFIQAQLDVLILENVVLTRAALPDNLPDLLASWQRTPQFAFGAYRSAISETLYTFV